MRDRATFQLTDNNTQLKVIFLERDKNLTEILEQSKEKFQYTDIKDLSKSKQDWGIEKKAFIFDKENGKVVEFDFIKNATELTAIIADQKNLQELNRYKAELQKLKNYIYDKIDQYPEIAKEISNDITIVSRELDAVARISIEDERFRNGDSHILFDVIDSDLYDQASRMSEEYEGKEEELQKAKLRGR
ncbi:hypothetical protein [Chryseobacterium culicis]|uniref:hypothetical protein n=1 Tax=Chryseobacterium culicis TaxID=680127 RepID=UPI001D0BED64|nr:hypothetical protein [Chryseobacterium culicis]